MRGAMRFVAIATVLAVAAVAAAGATQPMPQLVRSDASDVVLGLGGAGPYALSWTGIAPASEHVEVNGVPLLRGVDYTIDWARGMITFSRPLPATSTASITYLRRPGQSQANPQQVDLPAAIPLAAFGGTSVGLALRYQQQPTDGSRGVYGLRAGRNGATKVDASLFLSELTGATHSADEANRGYGWRIGAQRAFSQLDLAAALTRANKGFSAPQDLATPAGQQTLRLAAAYHPYAGLSARASTVTAENVADPAHAATRTNEYGLALKPMAGADVSVTRTQVASQQPSASASSTTDQLQANLALGSTTASAMYRTAAGRDAYTDAHSLNIASTLSARLKLAASQSETRSDRARERATDLWLDVGASRWGSLRASAGARRGDQMVDYRGVEATLKPLSALKVDASYKQRDYGASELNSQRAAVAATPLKGVEIGGEYAHNPEDEPGRVREGTRTKLRVATRLGSFGVTGSVARDIGVSSDEQRAGEVKVSLALALTHRLYTGYRQVDTMPLGGAPTAASEVYLLGYERAVGSDFSLSLEGQLERNRDYQELRSDTRQRADAKLNWRF